MAKDASARDVYGVTTDTETAGLLCPATEITTGAWFPAVTPTGTIAFTW
jgi:hypothetical protein